MQASDLCRKVYNEASLIALQNNVELWDVEFEKEGNQHVLTVYIDNDKGVDIETCETVSRALDDFLDEPQFSSLPVYTLCVSSAGLIRKLSKPEHFKKFIGSKVEIKFYRAIDGVKELEAILVSLENNMLKLNVNGNDICYDIKNVAYVKAILI